MFKNGHLKIILNKNNNLKNGTLLVLTFIAYSDVNERIGKPCKK